MENLKKEEKTQKFIITNNFMNNGNLNDTPKGAEVTAKEINLNDIQNHINESRYGFIFFTNQNIYHKDIKKFDKDSGSFTLSSRNKLVEDLVININNISKIYSVTERSF